MVEKCIKKVDWDRLEAFCKDELEYKEIVKMLGNIKKTGINSDCMNLNISNVWSAGVFSA